MQEAIAGRVFQFWTVGLDVETPRAPVIAVGASRAVDLRALIDDGRNEKNRQRFGLDLRGPALIVERWSLFDEGWGLRDEFRASMSVARHVDQDLNKETDLEFRWLTLANGVRDAAPVAEEQASRIRSSIASKEVVGVSLFIDRLTAAGSTIDRSTAAACYADLAAALACGELGSPGPGDGQRSEILMADGNPEVVHPISMLVLRHDARASARGVGKSLLRDLAVGRQVRAEMPNGQREKPLAEQVGRDLRDDSHNILPAEQRARRRNVATRFLATFLAEKDWDQARVEIVRARRVVREHGLVGAPAPGIMLIGSVGHLPLWIVGVGAVIASAYLALRYRIRSSQQGLIENPALADSPMMAGEDPRLGAWREIIDRLDTALSALELIRRSQGMRSPEVRHWGQYEGSPFRLRMGVGFDGVGGGGFVREGGRRRMAATCLERLEAGDSGHQAWIRAARHEAQRICREAPAVVDAVKEAAFSAAQLENIRDAVENSVLLANAGRELRLVERIWQGTPAILRPVVDSVEPAAHAGAALRVLDAGNGNETLRIAFGEPVRWSEMLSMRFLDAS